MYSLIRLDTTFLKRRMAKTIERDMDGNIWRINYNNQGRDPFLPLDAEQVQDLYVGTCCFGLFSFLLFKFLFGEVEGGIKFCGSM